MDCTTPPLPLDYLGFLDVALISQYIIFGFCVGVIPLSFAWGLRFLVKHLLAFKPWR